VKMRDEEAGGVQGDKVSTTTPSHHTNSLLIPIPQVTTGGCMATL
jgi:hypothetical protein